MTTTAEKLEGLSNRLQALKNAIEKLETDLQEVASNVTEQDDNNDAEPEIPFDAYVENESLKRLGDVYMNLTGGVYASKKIDDAIKKHYLEGATGKRKPERPL